MSLLLSLSILLLSSAAFANHYEPLHCTKWKGNCEKYHSHCTGNKNHHALKSCCELLEGDSDYSSGRYTLMTGSFSRSDAWCDMDTAGGGWLTILRRDGTTDIFDKKVYHEYEEGFGNLSGNFWFGLRNMRDLTSSESYEMRLDMYLEADHNNSVVNASYNSFQVEGHNYTLRLGNFTGSEPDLIDNLKWFNNRPFVARETALDNRQLCFRDVSDGAGWWYPGEPPYCQQLSSEDDPGSVLTRKDGLYWHGYSVASDIAKDDDVVINKYEMKIRPTKCSEQI